MGAAYVSVYVCAYLVIWLYVNEKFKLKMRAIYQAGQGNTLVSMRSKSTTTTDITTKSLYFICLIVCMRWTGFSASSDTRGFFGLFFTEWRAAHQLAYNHHIAAVLSLPLAP